MQPLELTERDHAMFHLAKERGLVTVDVKGNKCPATLLAWMPTQRGRRRKVARVAFGSGRTLTVPLDAVTVAL